MFQFFFIIIYMITCIHAQKTPVCVLDITIWICKIEFYGYLREKIWDRVSLLVTCSIYYDYLEVIKLVIFCTFSSRSLCCQKIKLNKFVANFVYPNNAMWNPFARESPILVSSFHLASCYWKSRILKICTNLVIDRWPTWFLVIKLSHFCNSQTHLIYLDSL